MDFVGIYTENERKDLISKEFRRLSKSLKDLDEQKARTLERLFNEAAFLAVTLEEARLIIIRDGIVEQYQNGANQSGMKKSSVVEVYDKYISAYMKVIDLINRSLPETAIIDRTEALMNFALLEQ